MIAPALGARGGLIAAPLIGALGALGLAPFGWWPLTLLALALLPALLWHATRPVLLGWLFGTGYFALAMAWIVEPFLVDIARHGFMAPFALVIMAGGLALFWALAIWAAMRLAITPRGRVLALIVAWSLAEYARAYVFTGLPWAALAQIWIDTPAAQLLAWIGPHGLALITLATGLGAGLLLCPGRARLVGLVPGAAFLALALAQNPPAATLTDKTVRLVQPNAPQHLKWDPDHVLTFFERQIAFTAAPSQSPAQPDLIIWPEASLPNFLPIEGSPLARIANAANGAQVVFGMVRPGTDGWYNSAIQLDTTGAPAGIYEKHHLVPFGEYIPLRSLLTRIGLSAMADIIGSGMSAGPGPALMTFPGLGKGLPLICYEAVFPQHARTPERADFIVQITNDAWFGQYSGPYQHLAQSRMRAIEQGLPLMRAANTGISGMIDPYGRTIKTLDLGETGFVDAPLPTPLPPTFYGKTGDLPLFFALFTIFLLQLGYKVLTLRALLH